MSLHQTWRNDNQKKSTRDVIVGNAVVPWGWTNDGKEGWRLPGRVVTTDPVIAFRAAAIMARLMA